MSEVAENFSGSNEVATKKLLCGIPFTFCFQSSLVTTNAFS